jgi:transketolase
VLIATGSEVTLALETKKLLAAQGIALRIVSMPSQELFKQQDADYRESVLPRTLPKISLEAGVTFGWHRYVGTDGLAIGVDRFGTSGPGDAVMAHLGFTPAAVAARITTHLSAR